MKTMYNHMFTICFTVENEDRTGAETTEKELLDGLRRRLKDLEKNSCEIIEATGMPDDTYAFEVDDDGNFLNLI